MGGYKIFEHGRVPCFITCVVTEWLPVFAEERYFRILTDSLEFCRHNKGLAIHCYVIMLNHLHLIVSCTGEEPLSAVLGDFKRFTSRQISKQAREDNWIWAASVFSRAANEPGQSYKVWQDGNNPQEIYTPEFFRQKAEYIHNNPVRKGLVASPADWKYSSARNYEFGDESVLAIDMLDL
ncbi:MAG: transposase [Armatimonadetes bacterium]|nr:transposase [Armatimonadota bacterium]